MTSPPRPSVTVTTSWDDGHRLDCRLAEILDAYDVPGTFYISPASAELDPRDRLSPAQVAAISAGFEVGAHTLTHPRLTSLSPEDARHEIAGSRARLEDVTGTRVESFCYPYGAFNAEHVRLVHEAGFSFARTTRRFSLTAGPDPLRAPTTVHAYAHRVDVGPALTYAGPSLASALDLYLHWDRIAMALFDRTLERGGLYHLWGHSWELQRHNDWARLRRVLDYISRRPGVRYAVNGTSYDASEEVA